MLAMHLTDVWRSQGDFRRTYNIKKRYGPDTKHKLFNIRAVPLSYSTSHPLNG